MTTATKTEEFLAGRGVVVRWERLWRLTHWFDAFHSACEAGYLCGMRVLARHGCARRFGLRSNAPAVTEASQAERQ